jgi:hypothetical protein
MLLCNNAITITKQLKITKVSAPVPATIEDELIQSIGVLLAKTNVYANKDDEVVIELWRQADKLAKADAAAALEVKAKLAIVLGDIDQAQYYVRNLKLLKAHDRYLLAAATVAINFGFFSESLPIYREMIDPERGDFSLLDYGVANGAYRTHVAALDRAQLDLKMKVHPVHEQLARQVAAIMEENGDSDEDIARAMDLAGELLREHKLLFKGLHHLIKPVLDPSDGGHSYFSLQIALEVDEETAVDLTCDYVDRLAGANCKIPSSLVLSFCVGE